MRNVLTYEYTGPENFSFWEWFWPDTSMLLDPESLRSSLEYYFRMRRLAEIVDSEVGPVRKVLFATDVPGRYVSTGTQIVKDTEWYKLWK